MIIDMTEEMLKPEYVIPVSLLKLDAYKLYPKDRNFRDQYFAKKMLTFLREHKLEKYFDTGLLIDEICKNNLPKNYKAIKSGGYLAGSLFIHMLSLMKENEKINIERAKFLFEKWNLELDQESLKKIKTKKSFRSMTTAWSEFGSVAHIWATEILEIENEISLSYKPNQTLTINTDDAKTIFDTDARIYIAYIKEMERQFQRLDICYDFWKLPEFNVGMKIVKMDHIPNDAVKEIMKNYYPIVNP